MALAVLTRAVESGRDVERRATAAVVLSAAVHRATAVGQVVGLVVVARVGPVEVQHVAAAPACSSVRALRWHESIPTSFRSIPASWDSGHVPTDLSSQMGQLVGHSRRYNTS